jgi:hypothetical protein
MLVWLAHAMFAPANKGRQPDEGFIAGIMAQCASHGYTTVYVQPRYVGKAVYRSKVVAAFDSMYTADGQTLRAALAHFDPYDAAVAEAKRRGLKVMAQVALFDLWFPRLEDRFYEQHPEYLMADRRTQRLYYQGVPCYAETSAQEYCLAEIRELLGRGAEGIALEMDSHQISWWPPGYGPPQPDSFGFNAPVVAEYQRRYGVNVLKEDYDKKQWYALHGEFFTRFLRRVKDELKEKPLVVGVPPEGYLSFGAQPYWRGILGAFSQGPAVKIPLEWEKWLREGIVDALKLYVPAPTGPCGPYAMAVAEAMRRRCDRGKLYLHVSSGNADEVRELIAQVRRSSLQGFIFHEEAYCESKPELWKALAV